MAASQNHPLKAKSILPNLTVDDLQRSMQFFSALGFEVDDRWEQDGVLIGVTLRAGGVGLGLSQDDGKKGRDRVKGAGMRLYIEVDDDIDAVAERARTAGVTLGRDPHDTEWGARAFEVTEPTGFLLTIASTLSQDK